MRFDTIDRTFSGLFYLKSTRRDSHHAQYQLNAFLLQLHDQQDPCIFRSPTCDRLSYCGLLVSGIIHDQTRYPRLRDYLGKFQLTTSHVKWQAFSHR